VWVTAAISCIIGGFATGTVDRMFLTSASPVVSEFLPAVIAGVVAGAALYFLMPPMSGRMVGLGTAVLAGFSGAMVGVVAAKALGSSPMTWVLTFAASVVLITWMVSGATTSGAQFRPFQQRTRSWNEIDAMDRESVQMQHDQAERGYWGSMEEPVKQDES
jgi:hypothetical protein